MFRRICYLISRAIWKNKHATPRSLIKVYRREQKERKRSSKRPSSPPSPPPMFTLISYQKNGRPTHGDTCLFALKTAFHVWYTPDVAPRAHPNRASLLRARRSIKIVPIKGFRACTRQNVPATRIFRLGGNRYIGTRYRKYFKTWRVPTSPPPFIIYPRRCVIMARLWTSRLRKREGKIRYRTIHFLYISLAFVSLRLFAFLTKLLDDNRENRFTFEAKVFCRENFGCISRCKYTCNTAKRVISTRLIGN